MKVLIISDYRDILNSVRPEGELFIGLKKAGVDLTLMTFGDGEFLAEFKKAGIRVIDFHPEKKVSWSAIRFIRAELKRGKYDILHLFNSKAISNGAFAAIGIPVKVLTYRGVIGITKWYNPNSYLKHLHPRIDGITAVSKAIQSYLQTQIFFNKNKVKHFYKGQNLDWYKNTKTADLKEFNLPKDAFIVTCVANYRRFKRIDYLINSTHFLAKNLPIYFLLIGRNMDATENVKLLKKSPYQNHFHLTGYRQDAINLVKASDVYIQPSDHEGLGKGILEAMSLGIPPIVTNTGGPAEFVDNEQSGLIVEVKNARAIAKAIERLYNDENLRKRLAVGAKATIEGRMNIRQSVVGLKRVYEAFLKA
ncbi:MAG: glycosyltransferase involved in cell wall biosynthesis [Paraglaciecola sp.]|jgi:glycosyltransferase involved in cell wall biosynthesis